MDISSLDIIQTSASLKGSLLLFTRTFYPLITGREFILTYPIGRESHIITVCRELTNAFNGDVNRLLINIPPRYGKTTLVSYFVPWAFASYPDSQFMYVSYSVGLSKEQTQNIRTIIKHPVYKALFGISIAEDSSAKSDFRTTAGGAVYAAGKDGSITGKGAGLSNVDRFGGAFIIDDIHKPVEVTSDTIRDATNDWFHNTAMSRLNDPKKTPIIFIGQRLHEDDMPGRFIKSGAWKTIILPALDANKNSLDPNKHTTEMLLKMEEDSPYVYASQYQQNPQPAGGGIFKEHYFYVMDKEPNILFTFITVDTAETPDACNDATVFSFWGLYKIDNFGQETDMYALHWLNCLEIRIEPKDLQSEFMDFFNQCMLYKVKPTYCAIEKKSTGVTMLSILQDMRGIIIKDILRTKASGNKGARYQEIQPYIAQKRVSLPYGARHTRKCIEHCSKITLNDSHAHDDIADTMYDAIKITLIDGFFAKLLNNSNNNDAAIEILENKFNTIQRLKNQANARNMNPWHT